MKSLAPIAALFASWLLYTAYSLPHLFLGPIGTHGWRQAIATSVARVYAQGQPFLYPRAEGCGNEPGIFMGMEFPLYAWLMGKLGGERGIDFVGRVMGILSALAQMLGIVGIVRHLFQRWAEPYRTLTALAAGCFIAFSPLYRFYGISFVPDVHAHALTLLAIGLMTGAIIPRDRPLPLTWPRFAVAAALIVIGCLTKLIAGPHCVLAGLVLLERARPTEDLRGFFRPKPIVMGALLVLAVGLSAYLWYVRWNRVLKGGGCELVWLPEKPDETWKTMTYTDPEWIFRMKKWGREDLLGAVWPLCILGIPLAITAGVRGLVFWLWTLTCAAGYIQLGWHTKQHDYDFLLVLPFFAIGFGTCVGLAARLVGWLASLKKIELPAKARPYAVPGLLAVILLPLSPYAHRQSRRHFYEQSGETETAAAIDKVLPAGEPIHYFGGKNDPRVPYFASRHAWGTELWFYCQQKDVKYDCALMVDTKENLAPCLERGPSVAWADRSLVCGITHPEAPLAAPRLLETIARSIHHPKDVAIPGVGRFLGSDEISREGRRFVDLYFVPETNAPPLDLTLAGKHLDLRPAPAKWLKGTIMVARAEVAGDGSLALEAGGANVPVEFSR